MRWTIAKKAGLLIIGVLSATLTVTFFILTVSTGNQTQTSTQMFLEDIEQTLIHSLTFAMGQGLTDCKAYIQKVKQIENVRDLAVLPRNSIRSNSEEQMDATERAVLSTKESKSFREIFRDEPVIRNVRPILADSTCVSCHGGSNGDVLALVNIRYSVASIESGQRELLEWTIALALVSIGIASFFVVFLLHRQVGKPLATLVSQSEAIAQGDLTVIIDYESKDEIGALAHVFRRMTSSLKNSISKIIEATAAVASASTEISSWRIS